MDKRLLIKHSSYCDFLSQYLDNLHQLETIRLEDCLKHDLSKFNKIYITPLRENHSEEIISFLNNDKNLILIVDYNHYYFGDLSETLRLLTFNEIQAPLFLEHPRFIKKESPYSNYLKQIMGNKSPKNTRDYLFISQPLIEDNRNMNQFKLIRKAIKRIKREKVTLYVKRHPREATPIPKDIIESNSIIPYEESIENGICNFKNLIGFNSLPLLACQSLDRQVYLWNEKLYEYQES